MNYCSTKTLAFIFTTFPPEVSGCAYYNWERVQWLAQQKNYRVLVLAPEWQDDSSIPSVPLELEQNLIIETYPSKPWFPYKFNLAPTFSAARYIRKKLAYYQPDLITIVDLERLFWFGTWHLPGRNYAKKRQIKYLSEYHTDYYNHLSTYPIAEWLRETLKAVTRYLYHQCDVTLSISPAATKSLQQMKISNFHTIPMYGLNLSAYSPSRRNRKYLATWLSHREQNNKVILFIGRLAREKRVDLLIEAFANLKKRQDKCSLIIAGDGPTDIVKELKCLAKPIGNIHFIGFVGTETKANILASSDVFCSPAPYETFGRTSIEAMASGITVVSIKSGGVSDYLTDGVNSYLVTPHNVNELTNAIEKALSNNNAEIIECALQDAERFSLERRCQNLNNYYQQLLM